MIIYGLNMKATRYISIVNVYKTIEIYNFINKTTQVYTIWYFKRLLPWGGGDMLY